MKKWIQLFLFLAIPVIAAGCNIYQASPGPVLQNSLDGNASNRIVTFTVTGKGVEPEGALTRGQARLMAERAAVADGYRQFVEKLRGVYVEAYARAGYGTIDKDMVKTTTRSVLRGVEITEITHGDLGIASAVMQLRIHFTRHGMIWWPEGLGPDLGWYDTAASRVSDTP